VRYIVSVGVNEKVKLSQSMSSLISFTLPTAFLAM
jgi:hypothetical protein